MSRTSVLSRTTCLGLTLGAGWIIGCGSPTGGSTPPPPPPPPSLTVTSVNPVSALRDLTLDVHVIGTGFEQGARAVWARGSDTTFAVTRVKTNSTTFASATELVANITIEADAHLGPYNVNVIAPDGRSGGPRTFGVNPNIETIDLGAGDNSVGRGVNNQGQIVGDRGANPRTIQAFLWENGTITNLGVLPGMAFSYAFAINATGQVVGVSGTGTIDAPIQQLGFLWTRAGGMQALSTLGGAVGFAEAINDGGDIAGFSTVSGISPGHAVVWRNSAIADVQSASLAASEGRAFAINNLGQVVGYIYGQGGFRWTPSTPMQLLVGPGGLPRGINDAGCIAGFVTSAGGEGWRQCAGVSRNVGSCGGVGSRAWAMNAAGQVVGDASNGVTVSGGVQQVAFLWTDADGIACFPLAQGSNGAGASAVNNNDWVVGSVSRPVGGLHATLWKVR